ncbi:MAG: TetR/AcrR family transcriptional regulator, partial [Sciscionella sp.]
IALVGMSEVSARFWLDTERKIDKEDAVALLSTLAWRGIGAGFPLQHS